MVGGKGGNYFVDYKCFFDIFSLFEIFEDQTVAYEMS